MSGDTGPGEAGCRTAALLLLTLALVALAHAPALQGGFAWDDRVLIETSPVALELRPLREYFAGSFFGATTDGSPVGYYRPLSALSFALDHALWDGHALGFHATNLLLHLACTAVLFALCLGAGAGPVTATLAAAFFGLAPRLTECVAWISGRTDPLAGLAALGALAVHQRAGAHLGGRLAAAALLLCGLLAKEVAVAVVPALVALELCRHGTRALRRLRNLAPATLALLVYAGLRIAAGVTTPAAPALPGPARIGLVFEALGTYALMLVDPLRPQLQIGLIDVGISFRVCLGAGALLGLGLLATALLRRRCASELAAFALGTTALACVVHAVPLPLKVVAADRLLYLPLAAAALLGAALAQAQSPRRRARLGAVAAALLVPFATATTWRSWTWTDEVALWQAEVYRAHPLNSRPHLMLGEALLREGRPDRALEALRRAYRVDRAYARDRPWADTSGAILGNVAGALAALGRTGEATELLIRLAEREPERPQHHFNLGVLHARTARREPAMRALERARRLAGAYPAAERLQSELTTAPLDPAEQP